MSKKIIIFYSFEGNTKKVAEFLSKELNLVSEEIKPIKDLKSNDKEFSGKKNVMPKKSRAQANENITINSKPIPQNGRTVHILTINSDTKNDNKKPRYQITPGFLLSFLVVLINNFIKKYI